MSECRFCNQGDTPIRSSVSDKMVHMDVTGHKICEGVEMQTQEPEPAWIRDTQAANVQFDPALESRPSGEWIAELCAGETSYCEHCGARFPMWPTKGWADHLVAVHGEALTIQARTGSSLLCSDELNECQIQFFSMMFQSRASLRRRAWQLGYAHPKEQTSRIHLPS